MFCVEVLNETISRFNVGEDRSEEVENDDENGIGWKWASEYRQEEDREKERSLGSRMISWRHFRHYIIALNSFCKVEQQFHNSLNVCEFSHFSIPFSQHKTPSFFTNSSSLSTCAFYRIIFFFASDLLLLSFSTLTNQLALIEGD